MARAVVPALAAALLVMVPGAAARAAQPRAVPGAGPVARDLPRSGLANRGLPAGVRPPVEPPRTAVAAGSPASRAALAAPGVGAMDGPPAPAPASDLLVRPGYLLGDTSLVVYFEADVAGDPTAWDHWFATVTDVQTGVGQRSVVLDRAALDEQCGVPRTYCRAFGAGQGWTLTAGRPYVVTISVRYPDGTVRESLPSQEAQPRTTVVPPSVPDAQASGCACPNILTRSPGAQALRGDAVNTATGSYVRTEQDLSMASFGIPFQAARLYSSANDDPGMFGPGWSWTYDVRVFAAADGSARVRAEDGSVAVFAADGKGGYVRPAGVTSTLVKTDGGWTLTTADRRTASFDAAGRMVSVTNRRGHGVRLAYDAAGRLTRLTDAAGRVVTVSTDAAGLITGLRLPDGRTAGYSYTGGRLTAVRDARGLVWRYGYEASGRLAGVTDPDGVRIATVTYDPASHRVVSQANALGAAWAFAWDAASQVATTTDPDGVRVTDGYRGNVLLYTRDARNNAVVVRYDPALNRNLAVDAQGAQTEVEYDGDGNVVQVRAADRFAYVEKNSYTAGNLDKHVDARGNAWSYSYNASGEMTGQADPEQADAGKGYSYTYDDRGLVLTRTDARTKVTRYEYDAAGNRTAEVTPTGRRTEFGYDVTGRLVWVTDPRGTAAGTSALVRARYTTKIGYDAEDRTVTQQQPGKVLPSRWVFDHSGQVVEVIDPLCHTTKVSRDAAGRVVAVTDPRGNRTRYAYTAAGRTLWVSDAAGGRTSWTYDVVGRTATETSPRGNALADAGAGAAEVAPYVTTFVFDPAGNLLRSERPYPGGGKAQVDARFDELNRPVTQLDELGGTTKMAYDLAGNITTMTDEAGHTLGYSYDKTGRRITGTDDAGNSGAKVDYDAAGLVTRQTSPTGGVVTYTYDDDGRPVATVEPRGNVAGADPAAYTTKYGYDPAGNLVSVIDPLGHTTTRAFDGVDRVVRTVDANGATTAYDFDDADRLTSVTGPVPHAVTRFSYDAAGNATAQVDPQGRLRQVRYDELNRPTEQIDPLGRHKFVSYDADGNVATQRAASNTPELLLSKADKARLTTTFTYDPIGRLTSRRLGSDGPTYSYGYDAAGRVTSYADPTGLTTNTYDSTGLLKAVTRGGRVFTYTYDGDDNVTSRTYPDGTKIAATYDAGDRMTSLTTTRTGSEQKFTFGYDVADHLVTTTYPGSTGAAESLTYDAAGRLTQVQSTSGTGYLARYELARDNVGNPTGITTTRRAATGTPQVSEHTAYAYDSASRLTAACYGATGCGAHDAFAEKYEYGYDLVGNRTKQTYTKTGAGLLGLPAVTVTSYAYDAADQLRSAIAVGAKPDLTTYDYDGEGNQTRAGRDTFNHNLDHTLASATVAGQKADFAYDGSGNRIAATVTERAPGGASTTSSRFWEWDVNNALPMLAVESAATGDATAGPAAGKDAATTRAYTYGQVGQTLALHTGSAGGASGSVYTHDWLGGTSAVLSAAGATQWTYDYDPFGNPRGDGVTAGGTKVAADAPANPLQYTGGYNDTTATRTDTAGGTAADASGAGGNYHLRARDYDPSTGRFTATDPVAQGPGATSAYSYTGGRPTAATDPSGMDVDQQGPSGAGSATAAEHRVEQEGPSTEPEDPDPLAAQRAEAQKAVSETESLTSQLGDELIGLIADLIGITDAKKCITEGDIGACVSTALNFVPWGKLFKAAKVAWKAIGLGRRLAEGYSRLKTARRALEEIIRQGETLRKAAAARKAEAVAKAKREAAAAASRARAQAQAARAARAKARQEAAKIKAAKARARAQAAEREKIANRRPAGCTGNSFTGDTQVLMADGTTKPIAAIRPGDAVLAGPASTTDEQQALDQSRAQAGSRDGGHPTTRAADVAADRPDAARPVARQVSATITGTGTKQLIDLTLVGAGAGGGGPPTRITATTGHAVWTIDRGWVTAGDLRPGDRLTGPDGATTTVAVVRHHTAVTTVHNLTVDDRHTYYVTTSGATALVHNTSCDVRANNRSGADYEAAFSVDKEPKVDIESVTGTATHRTPDLTRPGFILDMKNVRRLRVTDQIIDMAEYAARENIGFFIVTRQHARLSPAMRGLAGAGLVTIFKVG